MENTIFKTEIVNGKCPHCNFNVVLISLASDHFRCTTCGSDLEQKINGKISYMPHVCKRDEINIRHFDE